jgi:hypothetical protein
MAPILVVIFLAVSGEATINLISKEAIICSGCFCGYCFGRIKAKNYLV